MKIIISFAFMALVCFLVTVSYGTDNDLKKDGNVKELAELRKTVKSLSATIEALEKRIKELETKVESSSLSNRGLMEIQERNKLDKEHVEIMDKYGISKEDSDEIKRRRIELRKKYNISDISLEELKNIFDELPERHKNDFKYEVHDYLLPIPPIRVR